MTLLNKAPRILKDAVELLTSHEYDQLEKARERVRRVDWAEEKDESI